MAKIAPKPDRKYSDRTPREERKARESREDKKFSDVKSNPRAKINPDGTKTFDQSTFFASCPREVEHLLEKEIRDLGITRIEVEKGGVAFKCETEEALDVLLNSRVASRVFKEIQVYTITSEKDIYTMAKEKWWDKIFDVHQTFKINTLFEKISTTQLFFHNFLKMLSPITSEKNLANVLRLILEDQILLFF
jgi:hypothetical protein